MGFLMLTRLPLGLSTFAKIRKLGYLYVDKTNYAYDLIAGGHRYFLSRPRRFGKSLFVSTLKEILEGNSNLFGDLWIEKSDYSWQEHGVILLDLSTLGIDSPASFKMGVCYVLERIAKNYNLGISVNQISPEIALNEVVDALYKKFGHVAILIDEYDHPLLQVFKNDVDRAREIRDTIRRFFSAIKGLDAYIDFVFITGVSSFSQAGLFSGMNNLQNITLDQEFATICGYDDNEVDDYFLKYIQAWAEKTKSDSQETRERIREWYNGYHFGGNVSSVYNPFSLMNALKSRSFKNYWLRSGTPTFLIEELAKEYRLKEYKILDLEGYTLSEDSLGIFEIGATPLPILMFQTGYLTITEYDDDKNVYKLGYPNFEVKTAFQQYLLGVFTELDIVSTEQFSLKLTTAFEQINLEEAVSLLKQLFVRVPYQIHVKEEKFYHALLQVIFGACGIKSQSEISISHGRLDLVLELSNLFYVIEVKLNASSPDVALAQIKERKYYEAYIHYGKTIVLLGLSFNRAPKEFDIKYVSETITPKKNG